MVRPLKDTEIIELLNADIVARLATIDAQGYPHVTPLWFLWVGDAFHLTSYAKRPHLDRIRANPRVGLVIDTEDELRADGERPNRQVRALGDATTRSDASGFWTRRIREKYIDHAIAPDAARRPPRRDRVLITIVPRRITAVASV